MYKYGFLTKSEYHKGLYSQDLEMARLDLDFLQCTLNVQVRFLNEILVLRCLVTDFLDLGFEISQLIGQLVIFPLGCYLRLVRGILFVFGGAPLGDVLSPCVRDTSECIPALAPDIRGACVPRWRFFYS